jgi:hypothetical protein
MVKKLFLFSLAFFLVLQAAAGNDYRNITTVEMQTNSYGGISWIVEDAFISKLSKDTTLILKGYHNQKNNRIITNSDIISSLSGTVGLVMNFGAFYSEFSYTLSQYPGNVITHTVYADATKEGPEFLITPSIKGVFTANGIVLMPSFSYFNYSDPLYKFKGKLFSSIDFGKRLLNGALWLEGSYTPPDPFTYRVGAALGTMFTEGEENLMLEFSLLPGLDWRVSDTFVVKYNFSWIIKQNSYQTLGHNLVFDVRF